jgi:hypothetical protein
MALHQRNNRLARKNNQNKIVNNLSDLTEICGNDREFYKFIAELRSILDALEAAENGLYPHNPRYARFLRRAKARENM